MKILVTGASGFIGNHVVSTLLSRGHSVIACARDASKARKFAWFSNVRFIEHDLSETATLDLSNELPDVLVHAAWDHLGKYRDPAHFETTLLQHYRFISTLVRQGLPQCLVLGTCLEYGMQGGALKEDQPCKPALAYPLAKHLLHQMLQGLQFSEKFRLQWLRLFYLYGPGQRQSSLLAQLDAAIDKKQGSFDMSPGDQLRDYLPVEEVALIIARVAEHQTFDGMLNCSSGKPVSVRQLVEDRLQTRGAHILLNTGKYPYPDYEPREFWGDRTRLDLVLGLKP